MSLNVGEWIKDLENVKSLRGLSKAVNQFLDENPKSIQEPKPNLLKVIMTYGQQDLKSYVIEVEGLTDSNMKSDGSFGRITIRDKFIYDEEEIKENSNPTIKQDEYIEMFTKAIVNVTDCDRIYNSALPVLKNDYLARKVPLIHKEINNFQAKKVKFMRTGRGVRRATFAVGYSDVLKKYILQYNPDFLVEMAVKEYLHRSSTYSSFKDCFMYMFMFALCHEAMHVLRHHMHNNTASLNDVDGDIVNRFGDAFINMDLANKLYDSNFMNKKSTPIIGISTENIYQGAFKDNKKGNPFKNVFNEIKSVLEKYTKVNFVDNSISRSEKEFVPDSNSKVVFKIIHPDEAVGKVFNDNSTYFIKCMNEIISAIVGDFSQIKKEKPGIDIGTSVRVKKTGDRGVVVEKVKDGVFKVAGSSAAEGDDEKAVEDYENNNDINILGDFQNDELIVVKKQYDKPDSQEGQSGETVKDVEVEDHSGESDNNDSGTVNPPNDNSGDSDGFSVGDTVIVNGLSKKGVITSKNPDGTYEVEGIRIIESKLLLKHLTENFEKDGNIIGTFSGDELSSYSIPNSSSKSSEEGDKGDEVVDDSEDQDDESDENQQDGSGNSGEDMDGLTDELKGENSDGDSEGDSEGDVKDSNLDKSAIDDLIEDISNNIDDTNADKEESDEVAQEEREDMDEKTAKDARDKLERDIKKSIKNAKREITDEEADLMKSIGMDKIAQIPQVAQGQWQSQLKRLLSNTLGVKYSYDPNRPSRRVPDAFGAPKREKDVRNIVIAMDYSRSMGGPKFKESVKHLQTFLTNLKSQPKFNLIFWGGKVKEIKKNGDMDGMEVIETFNPDDITKILMSKGMGDYSMTTPLYAFHYMVECIWDDPDIIIFFTDGMFNGSGPDKNSDMYIRRNYERIVWVLTKNARLNDVKGYDPTVKVDNRYVQQK